MKKMAICIFFICISISICISICACEEKILKDVKTIELLDFSVSDKKNDISLDFPYKKFKIDEPEEKIDNNHVGETYFGEFVYKTYIHKYADFDLYVSNSNYNLKKRNYDEYYITQITLKNSNYKTYSGITIGSKVEEINKAYGKGEKSTVDGKTVLNYTLNDMGISFTIDENQKVQAVVLSIIIKEIQ